MPPPDRRLVAPALQTFCKPLPSEHDAAPALRQNRRYWKKLNGGTAIVSFRTAKNSVENSRRIEADGLDLLPNIYAPRTYATGFPSRR